MQILHLEDSDTDAELIGRIIRREWPDCAIRRAAAADEFDQALRGGRYDVILSDYSMPGFDGLLALQEARRRCPSTPFLFVSGMIGEERAVEALKHGATDYIIKDRPGRLVSAIRQALALIAETDRRRATEEALRQNDERVRLITENISEHIVVLDTHGRRTYSNRACREVFGEAIVQPGTDWCRVIEPADVPGVRAVFDGIIRTGEGGNFEFRCRGLDGTVRTMEATGAVLRTTSGAIGHVIIVARDVTERKKLEGQLLRAQRLESVGTLAGGVAHDLNNVLTPILCTMDLLAGHACNAEERELIDKTRASAQHGAALIRQLLAFARGAEGERTTVPLRAALDGVEPLVQQLLPHRIELAVQCADDAWPIVANTTQFNQAVINLALNARDAMPQGGRVAITTENVNVNAATAAANPGVSPGRFVRVSVSDTGTGISSDNLVRVFDPFFTTKPVGKGTGLGLSMVASILRSHGGFVQVESELGRGSVFHLHFPAATLNVAPAKSDSGATRQAAGEGVLLVDDEPAVRETLRSLLQRAGYAIYPAADAGSAVREFEHARDRIALVITDMMLPDGSGVDVVKTIRAMSPQLPIIAISGMMESGRYDELKTLTPPVECLSKPLPPRVLLSAAHRALHAT